MYLRLSSLSSEISKGPTAEVKDWSLSEVFQAALRAGWEPEQRVPQTEHNEEVISVYLHGTDVSDSDAKRLVAMIETMRKDKSVHFTPAILHVMQLLQDIGGKGAFRNEVISANPD